MCERHAAARTVLFLVLRQPALNDLRRDLLQAQHSERGNEVQIDRATVAAFTRYVMCKSIGDTKTGLDMAEQLRETPQVYACLQDELETKAAVAPGTTTDATFAGPLAAYGIAGEALQLLRGASIIGQLEPKMRRVPFRVTVPKATGTGTNAAWIGQNLSTPVAATAYSSITQDLYKCGVITVLSKELVKIGNPDSERTVRETVVGGTNGFTDGQFLTPTVTAIADLRPAAITNGATAVTSTGTTAAQINVDLAAMLAAITTPGAALTWIMRPTTAYRIAATIGGTAAADIPRTPFGMPLVLSLNSPQQVTLVDASEILYSDGGIGIDRSEQAALQMDTLPTDPPTAATVYTSLWQRGLVGIRVVRWLAYQRTQTGAVSYMTTAY